MRKCLKIVVDLRSRISLIYKNETRADYCDAREASRAPAGDQRDPARLAAGADHPQPCARMRQMRERRRPPAVGSHGELPRWTHAAVQSAARDGSGGAWGATIRMEMERQSG